MLRLFSGNILAQGILLLSGLWLPLLYSPEAFGYFSVFVSATTFLGVILTGRYELAIVLPPSDEEGRSLFRFTVALSLAGSALCLLAIPLVGLVTDRYPALLLLAIVVGGFASAVYQAAQFLLSRERRFSRLAQVKIVFSLGVSLMPVLLYAPFSTAGLTSGYLAGQIISLVFIIKDFSKWLRNEPKRQSDEKMRKKGASVYLRARSVYLREKNTLLPLARRYWPIIRFSLPSGILNTLSNSFQPLLIGAAFGLPEAGAFFLAYRLLSMPLGLLTQSIGQVYFPELNERLVNRKGNAFRFTIRLLGLVLLIAGPLLLLAFFIAPPLLAWLFGPRWADAGRYLAGLIPFFFGKSLHGAFSSLAEALNRTLAELLFNIASVAIILFAVWLGHHRNDTGLFLQTYSLTQGAAYLLLLGYFLRNLYLLENRSPREPGLDTPA